MSACPGLRPRWFPEYSPSNVLRIAAFRRSARRQLLHDDCSSAYPYVHENPYFGAQYTACILAPSGFGLPLLGLPAEFATDLLAKL